MFTTRNQQLSKVYYARPIKAEECDGCTADRRDAYECRCVVTPRKVFVPAIISRMIQGDAFPGNGVCAGAEFVFKVIAALAG